MALGSHINSTALLLNKETEGEEDEEGDKEEEGEEEEEEEEKKTLERPLLVSLPPPHKRMQTLLTNFSVFFIIALL